MSMIMSKLPLNSACQWGIYIIDSLCFFSLKSLYASQLFQLKGRANVLQVAERTAEREESKPSVLNFLFFAG